MNTLENNNLKTFVYSYFSINFFFFIFQLILSNTLNDISCLILLFISNIFILFYCFNKDYFFAFPISLLMIFFSHFINLGGSIIFKSIEKSVITENLEYPFETISVLTLIHISIIIGHYFYRKSNVSQKVKKKIFFQLKNLNLISFTNINYLILISIFVILMRMFIYDLSITPIDRASYVTKDLNIFQDISKGLGFFVYMPVVIFFSNFLYNYNHFKFRYLYIFLYFISLIFISFSTNNRSVIFDPIFLILIILMILFLFNKIEFKKYFLRIIILCILALPIANFFENLSTNLANQRTFYSDRTPIENIIEVISSISSNEKNNISQMLKESNTTEFFGENYYKSSLLNRINILLINDNFIYIKKNISNYQIKNFTELQKNKIISIVPQPIINLFSDSFNKRNYLFSTASIFYKEFSEDNTSLGQGSALISLYIIFDNWVYLICLFFFIPFFIIFDSFYDNKNNVFSPFILMFFYTTGYGIMKFLAISEIYMWFEFTFRVIPQSILIFIILRIILNLINKRLN